MPKKATTAEAQLVIELYDLRREAEMRKARTWWATQFWPQSVDDIMKVAQAFGSQENAWFRQVGGYWDMAAALNLHGAINNDLFYDTCGEMWFTLAKVYPHLKQVREKMQAPEAFLKAEKVAFGTKAGKQRMTMMLKRMEEWGKRFASAKAGS
jgi:hypothetical protein